MSANRLRKALIVPVLCGGLAVIGCSPIVENHGYLPVAAEVAAITAGTDSKETVLSRLGEPTSKGVQGDSAWYYVSYTERKLAFLKPQITSREILAISFGPNGKVAAINHYGLENGVVVDLNTRETVTGGRRLSFLQQLIGNIGNFSAESFL